MKMLTASNETAWLPYCGEAPSPAHWLSHWNWDPLLLSVLAAILVLRVAVQRRTDRPYIAIVGLTVVLFVSPLCALGSALFLARSVHHLVLALGLAPLLVIAVRPRSFPKVPLTAATIIQAVIFWAWHLPGFYASAMSNDLVFWVMQVSITGSAAVWWAALRRAPALESGAALLAQMVQMGVLGALLVFANRAFYSPHWQTTTAWGLTPLDDQQIAGLIMWVAGGGVYLLVAMTMLWRTLPPDAQTRAA